MTKRLLTLLFVLALCLGLCMAAQAAFADEAAPEAEITYRYLTKDGQTVEYATQSFYDEDDYYKPCYYALKAVSGGYSFRDQLTEEQQESFESYLPPRVRLLADGQFPQLTMSLDDPALLDLNGYTLNMTAGRFRGSGELIVDSAVPGVLNIGNMSEFLPTLTLCGSDTVNITNGTIKGRVDVRGGTVNLSGGTLIGVFTVENDGTGADIDLTISGKAAIKTANMSITVHLDEAGNILAGLNNIRVALFGGYYSSDPTAFRTGHANGADYDQSAYVLIDPAAVEQYDGTQSWGVSNTSYYCWRVYETSYGIAVNGRNVTNWNAADILGDGTAAFEPDSNTLTFDNAGAETGGVSLVVSRPELWVTGSGVFTYIYGYDSDLYLNGVGSGFVCETPGYGIRTNGGLSLAGSITCRNSSGSAFLASTWLDIEDGAVITAETGSGYSCIACADDITIYGGTVSANGGIGICADLNNNSTYAWVTIYGGTVTLSGEHYGIYCSGDIDIEGGTVNVSTSCESFSASYAGLYARHEVNIYNGITLVSIDGAALRPIRSETLWLDSGIVISEPANGSSNGRHIVDEQGEDVTKCVLISTACPHANAVTAFNAEGHWLYCSDCEQGVEDSFEAHDLDSWLTYGNTSREDIATVRVTVPGMEQTEEIPANLPMGIGNTVEFIGENKTFLYLPDNSGRISCRDEESDSLYLPGGFETGPDDPAPEPPHVYSVLIPGASMEMSVTWEDCGYGVLDIFIGHGDMCKIWADKWFAQEGETVHFGASPLGGYRCTLTVRSGNTVIPYTTLEGGFENTFTMPAGNVTLEVTTEQLPTLVLPEGTKSVGESAFENSGAQFVILPDGCESIGPRAFKDCKQLDALWIPASVTEIDPTALDGCVEVCVYGAQDSAAQKFAQKQNNTYFWDIAELG